MSDIRSFFAPKGGAKAAATSKDKEKVKDENKDKDKEETAKKQKKKRVIEDSDSDSDFVSATPPVKKSKVRSSHQSPNKEEKKKLKTVNPEDFFGGASASSEEKKKKKENKEEPEKKKESKKPKEIENVTPPKKEEKTKIKSPRKDKDRRKKEEPKAKKSKYAPVVEDNGGKAKPSSSSPKKKPAASPEKPSLKVEAAPPPPSASAPLSLQWVDKYKPANLKAIIGQQGEKSNMRKLQAWTQAWAKFHSNPGTKAPARPPPWSSAGDTGGWAKAALLSGPPGVGKTTTAYLVAKELGYDVMEMNASDTRSKKLLEASIADAVSSHSLSKVSKKRILLMDEVDGMAGNEDRGGMAELIGLIKSSKIPVICMCNDRNAAKIRSLANHCFDLRFSRPRAEQIRAAMMSVCFKEKLKISPDALTEMIVGCNQDVRQVLHSLSMIKTRTDSGERMGVEQAKAEANKSKKTSIKVGPFDVVRKVFSAKEQREMSIYDKSDLFFQDYSMGPLFNQENYLSVVPEAANGRKKQTMELVSQAADSFCQGDLIDATIRSKNAWGLLPTMAMFSSVIPGEYMSGYMAGQIAFPAFLGKMSKTNKFGRMLGELTAHTRLKAGVSKRAMNQELSQPLRDAIVLPLVKEGSEGVSKAVDVMKEYALLREDFDNLLEATQWPNRDMPLRGVESKVKAAFTRMYNKEIVLPYATVSGTVSKKRESAPAADEMLLNEDEFEEDDEEEKDGDDISGDAMIKAKKRPAKAAASAKGDGAKGKGKGVGKGSRGGGKIK